jgi:hypothetical protein
VGSYDNRIAAITVVCGKHIPDGVNRRSHPCFQQLVMKSLSARFFAERRRGYLGQPNLVAFDISLMRGDELERLLNAAVGENRVDRIAH